ncbi:hypothetical protein [Nocardiopsis sp. NPDC006938]|uniref:hypothetical protein n=1 Tax=Nocardiopsis sp. NPDC006938 TaxID=3364337 RepID=UPI0036A7C476
MKSVVLRPVWFLFWASLAVFLLSGAVVVFGQLAGVLLVQPGWITALSGSASSVAFTGSALCACCAFVLQYTSRVRAQRPEDPDATPPEDGEPSEDDGGSGQGPTSGGRGDR